MRNTILHGDVIAILKTLADQTVNCIVTSPPYFGLRDYGLPPTEWPAVSYAPMAGLPEIMVPEMSCCLGLEDSIEAYVGHLVLVFRGLWRVLRADGVAWLNLGDSYCSSPPGNKTLGVSAASGLNGVNNPSGKYRETLEAGHATKKDTSKIVGIPPKNLLAIPWRVALALQAEGWFLRSDVIWAKPNGLPESVTDRPTKSHEYIFLLSKSGRYWYDAEAIREPHKVESLKRYEYGLHSNAPNDGFVSAGSETGAFNTDRMGDHINPAGRNARTIWTIPTAPFKQAHFAVFPPALVERCLLAGCPSRVCVECGEPWVRVVEKETDPSVNQYATFYETDTDWHRNGKGETTLRNPIKRKTIGFTPSCQCCPLPNWTPPDIFGDRWPKYYPWRPGIVLDPFFGSGTTGVVAERLGRDWLGIDLNPEYAEMARKRLGKTQPALPGIF